MADLARYLARIGFEGTARPDLATLRQLQRRHVEAIAFEGLDAQFGIVPSMEPEAIFAKLVERRRGGWCYEMNGLLGWALQEIGFDVTRISCAVMRQIGGPARDDTHLALLVRIDGQDWLGDVGFGSSLSEPIPLAPGRHDHLPFAVALDPADDGAWRFSEYSGGEPFSFDFLPRRADEAALAGKCEWQATAAESNFVQNLVAMKRDGERHLALRGRVLTERRPGGSTERVLADEHEFEATLRDIFGIEHPDLRSLWPGVVARHEEVFGAAA